MRLYNTLSREVEEVKPVDGHTVKMYSCGPTVYRYINITDVGHMTDEVTDTGRDKMELAEADEGLSAKEIAQKYTQAFLEDAELLGIERADAYPRATDHI